MLTALFGDGAILVAATFFAFGIVLWLPKVGLRVGFSAARFLALEIVLLSILSILHLGNSDTELRALARAGQGGGMIGWGLSYPVFWIMGRQLALAFFSAAIGICIVVFIGLERRHIIASFARFGARMRVFSEGAARTPKKSPQDETQTLYRRLAGSTSYRTPIMRIRPNSEIATAGAGPSEQTSSAQRDSITRIRPPKKSVAQESTDVVESPQVPVAQPESSKPNIATTGAITGTRPGNGRRANKANGDTVRARQRANWTESLPSIDCLTPADLVMPDEDEINHKATLIQNTLLEFDLETTVVDVQVGPTVTRYALLPHKEDGSDRIRMSKIASYARDLSLALAAKRLRMETPVPGTNYMGIEVPNKEPAVVALRNVLQSDYYAQQMQDDSAPLLIPLGRSVTGEPVSIDLAQMPHLLIAGATGSGKSVCIAAIATASTDAIHAGPIATRDAGPEDGRAVALQRHTASRWTRRDSA